MEKTYNGLPSFCYHQDDVSGKTIIIRAGVKGYFETVDEKTSHMDYNELNAILGITKGEAEAMKKGSMFGWDVPFANPENWNEDGTFKGGK